MKHLKGCFSVAALVVLCSLFGGIGAFSQDQDEISPDASQNAIMGVAGDDFATVRADAFSRLDENQNGVIEASEWRGKKRAFRLLDVNRDGVITPEEFMSLKVRWWNQTFYNLDLNGDRIITRDEWMDVEEGFNRLDRNHDGIIERREFYSPR